MTMKIFISWSGELSRQIGEALRQWLPSTLQYVRPYFTPEDVEKGTKWDTDIAKELETSDIGIICLTPDNTERPWVLFEAGALSKSIGKSRACTLLFHLEPADLSGPLATRQHTLFQKKDFKALINNINNNAGDARLKQDVLDNVFEKWWPDLEANVERIFASYDTSEEGESRSERDMIQEILELTRMTVSRQKQSMQVTPHSLGLLMDASSELLAQVAGERLVSPRLVRHVSRAIHLVSREARMPEFAERISALITQGLEDSRDQLPPFDRPTIDLDMVAEDEIPFWLATTILEAS
jgi:hypothetical protein